MTTPAYQYSAVPTGNPFRWLLACWRVSQDLTNTNEAAIVEIGFSRSWFGRRVSGWAQVTERLQEDLRHRQTIASRGRLGGLDLGAMREMPVGSLGHAVAMQCAAKGINPNLVHIDAHTDAEFVMAHVFETHDVWHVVTGWGNDEEGEVGLGGFYMAQLQLPLIALMLSLIFLNTALARPNTLLPRMEALTQGFAMGKAARPLFGVDWRHHFERPLTDVRRELGIAGEIVGEGVLRDAA